MEILSADIRRIMVLMLDKNQLHNMKNVHVRIKKVKLCCSKRKDVMDLPNREHVIEKTSIDLRSIERRPCAGLKVKIDVRSAA